MIFQGKWIPRVDTPEGRDWHKQVYTEDFFEAMIVREIVTINRIFPSKYRHIVFPEYDGTFNQVFTLEDGDHLVVYTDGCMDGCYFNTDGNAYFCLVRDGEIKGWFCVENSPYDMTEEYWDLDQTREELVENLKEHLQKLGIQPEVTESNVLFVRQL